jgi:Kef-type K+ transport system membrane component KefB
MGDRLAVGIGMIPRGEVGLIFAAQGVKITIDGHPLIEPDVYGALVLCIMATTIVTPPMLAWRLRQVMARRSKPPPAPAAPAPIAEDAAPPGPE